MTFEEHTHPEFEEGQVEIWLKYSVILYNDGDKWKGEFEYFTEEEAEERYDTEMESGKFDHVILNEIQVHTITKKIGR